MGLFDNLGDPLALAAIGNGAGQGYQQGYLGAASTSYNRAYQAANLNMLSQWHNGSNDARVQSALLSANSRTYSADDRLAGQRFAANAGAISRLTSQFPSIATQPPEVQFEFARNLDRMGNSNYSGENPGNGFGGGGLGSGSGGSPGGLSPLPGGGGSQPSPGGMGGSPGGAGGGFPLTGLLAGGGNSAGPMVPGPGQGATPFPASLPPPSAPASLPPPSVGAPAGLPVPSPAPVATTSLFNPNPLIPAKIAHMAAQDTHMTAQDTHLTAQNRYLGALGNQIGGKTVDDFYKNVGDIPAGQQAGYTLGINKATGSNYTVPGSLQYPTTPGGAPAAGPPAMTPAYAPLLDQAAGIRLKTAEAGNQAAQAQFTAGPKTNLTNNQAAVVIPQANAKIKLDADLGTAALGNMSSNASRAASYGQSVTQTGQYQQGQLGVAQGHLAIENYKATHPELRAGASDTNTPEGILKEASRIAKPGAPTLGVDGNGKASMQPGAAINSTLAGQEYYRRLNSQYAGLTGKNIDGTPAPRSAPSASASAVAPGAGPIAQSMLQKSGQPCNGLQCGQAITNEMGGQTTVTNLRNAAQRNPSLQVRPDAQGRYPNDTILYFKPTNGIVDSKGTNQHYGTVYTGQDGVQRITESTSAGAPPGGRAYRSDRTVAQVAAEHGNQVIGFRAAGGGNSGNAPGGASPHVGGRAALARMGIR